MGVYSCWYKEIFGYACLLESGNWIFVPDLGQPDQNVYRNLELDELIFTSPDEHRSALNSSTPVSLLERFKSMVFPGFKPRSVAGRLLIRS